MVPLRLSRGWQRRSNAVGNVEFQVLAGHAPCQRPTDPPVQLRSRCPLLRHDRSQDGDHVGATDLVNAPVHDRTAVAFQCTAPILRPHALPRGPGLNPVARRPERRGPQLPHDRCQWQPKTAHFGQLKTAHFGGARRGRIRRSAVDVHQAFRAGRRERSDRSPARNAARGCRAGGHAGHDRGAWERADHARQNAVQHTRGLPVDEVGRPQMWTHLHDVAATSRWSREHTATRGARLLPRETGTHRCGSPESYPASCTTSAVAVATSSADDNPDAFMA